MNLSPTYSSYPIPSPPSYPLPPSSAIATSSMVQVLGIAGDMGPENGGTIVSIRLSLTHENLEFAYVRLVLGVIPLQTRVAEIDNDNCGRWELSAVAPPQSHHALPGDLEAAKSVPIRLQVLDHSDRILDELVCGTFVYSSTDSSVHYARNTLSAASAEALHYPGQITSEACINPSHIARRRAYTLPSAVESPSRTPSHTQTGRRARAQSIIRLKYARHTNGVMDHGGTPMVELVTPLQNMCTSWSEDEARARRRLVQFSKVQIGCRFLVSCTSMSQAVYDNYPPGSPEQQGVVSCIYCPKTRSYHITSVDLIYLLERLVDDEFPVEEKNRIRRNLEGLKPVTISKTKLGYESYFHQIMEFPNPKPRNIEKDLKVFDWNLLGQAIDKILSKYSVLSPASVDEEIPEDDHSQPSRSTLDLQYPSLAPPCKTEPVDTAPHLLFSEPLLSTTADPNEYDRDSDSSSLSGRGWEPSTSKGQNIQIHTYGDYGDYAYHSNTHGYLFDSVRHAKDNQFAYGNDYGVTDFQHPMDISAFIDVGANMDNFDAK